MVRRTKEDALATREGLLDAAELLFQAKGVSHTSLNDIAREAGTTRGAIYWHFKDKGDLFNAMMDRATLPLEGAFDTQEKDSSESSLDRVRFGLQTCLLRIASDDRMRRVFEVATHKVEYVDELQAVRTRHLSVRNEFISKMELGLGQAAIEQALHPRVAPAIAALGLHSIIDGMIQGWLLEPQAFELTSTVQQVIDVYLMGLGFRLTAD